MKKCAHCEKLKNDEEFYKNNRTISGLTSWCKECICKYKKDFYEEHKVEILEKINQGERTGYMRIWRKNNVKKVRKLNRESRQRLALQVLVHYGGNPPKCICCGEAEIKFLTLDHIKNDGAKYRKARLHSYKFYRWLKKTNYPEGIVQVMCMNCNTGKVRNGGICPHKESGTY